MKKKNLLFCLLLLILGTTTAWADKYYRPWKYTSKITTRLTLEEAVAEGTKFMIYNTAMTSGGADLTGFLRNGGAKFAHDKTKERDYLIYNESFLYTMEKFDDNADGTPDWYAIKSVLTGTYVDLDCNTTHTDPANAKLYITSCDNATAATAGVRMESWKYNVTGKGNDGKYSGGNGATVFLVGNNGEYWNEWDDEKGALKTASTGHPFAFYKVNEITTGDYLQDLHIYSRADIYSAQVIYGYAQDADEINTVNLTSGTVTLPAGAALIDGDPVTELAAAAGQGYTFPLGTGTEVYLYLERGANDVPAKVKVEALATDGTWADKGTFETGFDSNLSVTKKIDLGGTYTKIRISNADAAATSLAELYVLPANSDVADAMAFFEEAAKGPLYTHASEQVYRSTVKDYNQKYSGAKLLSGVPVPGNKYRIYADAYDMDNDVYISPEVLTDGTNLIVQPSGSYHNVSHHATGTEKYSAEMYEWYCEQTTEGKLVFRNVATGKYLANCEMSDSPYEWTISTTLTHRFGVPLQNKDMQYLAMYNDADEGTWMGDIKAVQDQTKAYSSTDDKDTPDDKTDDVTRTAVKGLCTDFVFIPVAMAEGEKKITITGSDLVIRNTAVEFGGKSYKLPFSYVFRQDGETAPTLPTVELLCSEYHSYTGLLVKDGNEQVAADEKGTLNGNTLSFNWGELVSGDIIDIQLAIKKPFELTTVADASTGLTSGTALYLIRNKRPQGIAQQSLGYQPLTVGDGLDIPDDEIDFGDGGDTDDDGDDDPISSQSGQYFYAKFDTRDTKMSLQAHDTNTGNISFTTLDATHLFYFTPTEDGDCSSYYSVKVNNATTTMKLSKNIEKWENGGATWYVQPKATDGPQGYNIGLTILGASNVPGDAWCSNHTSGDVILSFSAKDAGSAWEFVPVTPDQARESLKAFIDKHTASLLTTIDDCKGDDKYDANKVAIYENIVKQFQALAGDHYTNKAIDKLVQFAQNVHMLEHEIQYALFALPKLSNHLADSQEPDPTATHWYYVKNVKNGDYAAWAGDNAPMALGKPETMTLANMYYFVGSKSEYGTPSYENIPGNNLIIDEFLRAHIHNFAATHKTLVSKNSGCYSAENITPAGGIQKNAVDLGENSLKGDEDWSLELEYNLPKDFKSYNAYGSALLASTDNPLADDYGTGFQIYLKDDRSLVIKIGNGDDSYRFWHTQDFYENIKVVITYVYSQKTITLDVYNSVGDKESKPANFPKDNAGNYKKLANIATLSTALPIAEDGEESATIASLNTYQVEAMTWKTHEEAENMKNKDDWYILPSSNLANLGFAIVLGEPNDNKMAWAWAKANAEAEPQVASDLGTADNSTWVFERVTNFKGHLTELLADVKLDGYDDCVIYNKELGAVLAIVAECREIITNKTGEVAEAAFNKLYPVVLEYKEKYPDGINADDLKAPKAGSLYTIRPDADCEQGLQVHIASDANGYSTKELYNGAYLRANGVDCDPRAAWVFEATDGGYKVKNLHTQCYIGTLGAEKTMVDEGATATVALAPLGGLTTSFKVGEQYASMPNKLVYTNNQGRDDFTFWGTVVTSDTYPAEVGTELGKATELTNATVYCKSTNVFVDAKGNVSVTFTHNGGSHKLNILGATLLDKYGKTVGSEYRHGTAGSNPTTQTYTIANVAPGAYTLNCYFGHSANGGNELDFAGGSMVIAGVSSIDGLTKVINTGDAATKWIIEEIKDPETTVYHEAPVTAIHMHGTMMLGFDAKIPAGVEAYRPCGYDIVSDIRYVSMEKYTGIIPAGKAVILKRTTNESTTFNFNYSATPSEETIEGERNDLLFGSLYNTLIDCNALRGGQPANTEGANHVFMLQASKDEARLFRIWENRNAQGAKQGNTDNGGYILNNANKAYFVLPFNYAPASTGSTTSFSLRYDGYQGTTAIEGVENEETTNPGTTSVYDLQGRKLTEITEPGIYIVNGKKIVVK